MNSDGFELVDEIAAQLASGRWVLVGGLMVHARARLAGLVGREFGRGETRGPRGARPPPSRLGTARFRSPAAVRRPSRWLARLRQGRRVA